MLWRFAAVTALAATLLAQDDPAARVDALFARWDRVDSPGAAVRVIKDGEPVLTRCYGLADLENGIAITPATVFDIASVSKQFCAFAVAMLVGEGKLDLTADVRTYLPDALPHIAAKITLDHLVHHTSGLRDWPATLAVAGLRMDDVITFEQILDMARQQRDLNFAPGERFTYSNTGYNLLAATVAAVGQCSFREWTERHVFAPLAMHDTHFHDDHTEVVARAARSYDRRAARWAAVADNLTALGSSSLHTTIDDLSRWIANFDTGTVGGAAVLARVEQGATLADGTTTDYAFGQQAGVQRGHRYWSHAGSWAGFRTVLIRFPQARLSIVVLANAADVPAATLGARIADVYLDAGADGEIEPRPSAPSAPAPDLRPPVRDLSIYAGRYWSEELATAYDVVVDGERLLLRHRRNGTLLLAPIERDRYSSSAWFASAVAFDRDDEGVVTGLRISSGRVVDLRFPRQR